MMEGTEETRDEAAAAADTQAVDSKQTDVSSPKASPSNTEEISTSRLSGATDVKVSDIKPDAIEDEDDVAEKEEEVKLVPKSKSKDSVKREEIEMDDHSTLPVAAPVSSTETQGPVTESHDVEQGKENGIGHPEKVDPRKKTVIEMMKKKEIMICFIGGVTFLIGLIMIITGLMIMQGKCDRQMMNGDLASNGHANGHNEASNTDPQVSHNRHHHQNHNNHHHDVEVPYVLHGTNNSQETHHHGNLAKDKAAYQSSTWLAADGSRLNASLAVDGIHSNKANKGHCAQTESQSRPYWYVDLETMHLVKRVKVVIPGDCCIGELHDFEVRVGPNEDLELNNICKHFMGTALKVSINIECDMELYGRYVSIQMLGDDVRPRDRLTLCEVMVYSK